jgi:hypothetical protein
VVIFPLGSLYPRGRIPRPALDMRLNDRGGGSKLCKSDWGFHLDLESRSQ